MSVSLYQFNALAVFQHIEAHFRRWTAETGAEQFVVGISGGKDSAVVAALLARVFGSGSSCPMDCRQISAMPAKLWNCWESAA